MKQSTQLVICGAGIAGIAAAYFLSQRGVHDIVIIDERGPMELTSGQSTECYRNWWGDPAMVGLMNRSTEILEQIADQTGNAIRMNRRGYLYVTGDEARIPQIIDRAQKISESGAGPLRIHPSGTSTYQPTPEEGYRHGLEGADLLLGDELVREQFPGITEKAVAALHVRKAGWLSAQQLGMTLLDGARHQGVELITARISKILKRGESIAGVRLSTGETIWCEGFIDAAGPFLREVGRMAGLELPVHTELHLKVAFNDYLGIINREWPLLIWDDPQFLNWNQEERSNLNEDTEMRYLLEAFPAGVHTRPEGGRASQMALMLWEFNSRVMDPIWPLPSSELHAEILLRGLSTMVPDLERYFSHLPRPQIDGGYYTKTAENRAIVGRTVVPGFYVLGALSGYGIMSACGLSELLAAIITDSHLPKYAPAFSLDRYADPGYLQTITALGDTGQL